MKYERWGEKVSKHSEWDQANVERVEEHSESQDQLDEVSQIVSQLSETGIEKSVERVQFVFDDELSAIKEERSQIEAARMELRAGIAEDMETLEQTVEELQSLLKLENYGKQQFLRTQRTCNKVVVQLNMLLNELNHRESSRTESGISQIVREYALIHAKVNVLCEAGWQVEDTIDNIDAKKLTMPMEERRRRGENYVNEIVDVYRDNLLDRGATDGEALDRKVAELRAHYSAELEKDLAGLPNELYTDPDYEQIMAKLSGEQSREFTDQASATNSQERRNLSPDQDNVFVRAQSAVNRSLLSMFPSRRAEMIDSSYVGASPEVVSVINKHIGGLKGITEIKQRGNGEWEGCHYNPQTRTIAMDERKTGDGSYVMTQHEYSDIFKHEIGHFIDHMLGNASDKPEFLWAMRDDTDQFYAPGSAGDMHLKDMLDDLFSTGAGYDRNVTDILSALFYNDKRVCDRFDREGVAYFQHGNEYWQATDGNGHNLNKRGKEIFANGFAIETDGYRISKDFIERWFPRINEQMKRSIAGGV